MARRQRQHGDDAYTDDSRPVIFFREKRYLPVKGILPDTMVEFLKVYYDILLANNKFFKDKQCPLSLALSGDPALDAMLEWIRPKISRLVGLELVPTYSYTRIYAKGEVLARHTDRPACEISLTISIRIPQDMPPSALHLKPPNMEAVEVQMREGDGCVYAGTEIEHWRDALCSDGYTQLFLHFIIKQGKYFPEYIYDQRDRLGV
jgi:hypothetical protein